MIDDRNENWMGEFLYRVFSEVLLQFKDDADNNQRMIPRSDLERLYNSNDDDPILYPTGSLNKYLRQISHGHLTINARVFDWYTIDKTGAECSFGNYGLDPRFKECFSPILS